MKKAGLTNIGTWNIHGGLQKREAIVDLFNDMQNYKLNLCFFQETYQTFLDKNIYTSHIGKMFFKQTTSNDGTPSYGQGLFISKKWLKFYVDTKYINNRLSISTFMNQQKSFPIYVINVYAPQSGRDETESNEFYRQLTGLIKRYNRKDNIVIVVGDFNAQIGQKTNEQSYLGNYGLGKQNRNGRKLSFLMVEHNLVATNTHFKHKKNQLFTFKGNSILKPSIIDYVMIPLKYTSKFIVTNSRCYNGTISHSDHKLLITTLMLKNLYIKCIKGPISKTKRFNYNNLISDKDFQLNFQQSITSQIVDKKIIEHQNLNQINTELNQILVTTAEQKLGFSNKNKNGPNYEADKIFQELKIKCQTCMKRINSLFSNGSRIHEEKTKLNRFKKCLKRRKQILENQYIENLANVIESNKGTKQRFEAVKLLAKKSTKQFVLGDIKNDIFESSNTTIIMPL